MNSKKLPIVAAIKSFFERHEISPITAITLLIISVGALFVRLYGLSEYAFNDDELWHLVVSDQKNLWEVIQYNFREEVHPPLSYIIWHYMLQISHNDLWLRMSGIIPGILLIPSSYFLGRLYLGGRAAGYAMAFIFAFAALPVSISTTIRAYSLMMLALTWAAIFLHKYRFEKSQSQRNKYLIYYSLAAFAGIELNHSVALVIFAFGLILILQTLFDKNKRDFFVVSLIHAILGFLVVGYAFILKHYYGFNGVIPGFYASFGDPLYYPTNYVKLLFWFISGSEIKDFVAGLLALMEILAFLIVPISLIRNKKWTLLHLIFTPLAVVITTDCLKIFPFSPVLRNNLFLFFSIIFTYAYFIQICANFFGKFWEEQWLENRKRIDNFVRIFAVLIATIFFTIYLSSHDYFRKTWPGCIEFSIAKSDVASVNEVLQKKNVADNVFVTAVRNVWYFQMQSAGTGQITAITKHLAKFESGEVTLYFMAFPARDFSTNIDMLEYKLFFQDLFAHLKSEKKLDKVKSFTFFDVGLGVDYLTMRYHPEFIPHKQIPFPAYEDKMYYKYWQEGYDISWAVHSSKQVLDQFYFRDQSFACGREILFLSFTPKFVRDEFLNKDLIDGREFEKKMRGL